MVESIEEMILASLEDAIENQPKELEEDELTEARVSRAQNHSKHLHGYDSSPI